MYNDKARIKVEEMWRMDGRAMQKFANIVEPRIKIIKVGKIEGQDLEGVEFKFTNNEDSYYMNTQEFMETFEKIY